MEHNKELLQQIKEELAKECGWKDFRTMAENVNIVPHDVSYIAKVYAEKMCEELIRWKREATLLIDPIIEYGQGHPDIKLGSSITDFVIERCKQYDELKAENERLTKAIDASIDNTNDAMRKLAALQQQHQELKEKAEKMEKMAKAFEEIRSQKNPRNRAEYKSYTAITQTIAANTFHEWKEGEKKEGQP